MTNRLLKVLLAAMVLLSPTLVYGQGMQADRLRTGIYLNRGIITITGATPSVASGNLFKTGNGGTTAISNFTSGLDTQEITVICGDTATSIVNGGSIVTASGTNFICITPNISISFVYDASQTKWIQKGGTGGGGGGGANGPTNSLQFNDAGALNGTGFMLVDNPNEQLAVSSLLTGPTVAISNFASSQPGFHPAFQSLQLPPTNSSGIGVFGGAGAGGLYTAPFAFSSQEAVGVQGIAEDIENGGAGPFLSGVQGGIGLFRNTITANTIGTAAMFSTYSQGKTASAPSVDKYYGLLFDDLGTTGFWGTAIPSVTEQAVIKIPAQTLSLAAGAKYAIKVDSGAGTSQWDSPMRFNACVQDTSGSCGTSGQVFSSTVTGTSWVAAGSGGAVTSVFGRVGAVVAATNDYTFAQINGTLGHAQLPSLLSGDIPNNAADTTGSATQWAGVTLSGTASSGKIPVASGSSAAAWATNAPAWTNVTAGTAAGAGTFALSGNTWDATAAAHTSPSVTGLIAALPATCAVGETYFAMDATVGRNDYHCTAVNTWVQVGWANLFTVKGDTVAANTAGAPAVLAGPTSPNGVPFYYAEIPAAGAATFPTWRADIRNVREVIGGATTDTIVSADCTPKEIIYRGTAAVATALPTATTLGLANCHFYVTNNTAGAGGDVTVTPATWNIIPGTTALTIHQGQHCEIIENSNIPRWEAHCSELQLTAGTNITITPGPFGPTITASSTAATAWSAITAGTLASQALLVGNSATFGPTGTGTINANILNGITVCGTPPTIGQALTATSTSAACWGAGGGGGTWATLTLSGINTGTGLVFRPSATGTVPFTLDCPTGLTVDCFDLSKNGVKYFWFDGPTMSMNFLANNLQLGSSASLTASLFGCHGGNTVALPCSIQLFNNGDTVNGTLSAATTNGRLTMQAGPAGAEKVQDFVEKAPAPTVVSTTTYTIAATDFGNTIYRTNALAMNDTLARAGNGTSDLTMLKFGVGWHVTYCVDKGSVGSVDLLTIVSTFSSTGNTHLILPPGACTVITSDGVNYKTTPFTSITLSRATIGVGNCPSGVPSTWWNTSLAAVCHTGSNVTEAVLPFTDGDTAQTPSMLALPEDWVGAIDVKAYFYSPSTSGTVILNVATACAVNDGSATDDVAYNTADAMTTVTLGATANGQWSTSKTGVNITGCAANRTLMLKMTRATDTAAGVVNLRAIQVTLRKTNLQ